MTGQLVMARLPRATFGAIVLGQVPALQDLAGITLVTAGVAVHRGR